MLLEEGGGHEGEQENQEGKGGDGAATGVERFGIVDRKGAEKTDADEHSSPDVPARPKAEAEKNQEHRKKDRREAMSALADGAEDVAAVELRGGKKIKRSGEEADPGGTADGMQKEVCGAGAMMKNRREEMQDERGAENDFVFGGDAEAGDKLGVHDAVDQRGNGDQEANERAGSADVKERACGANGRADEDERAERADQRRKGNEKRIAGMNMVAAAGEKMSEFVGQENRQERQREGESGGQGQRMAIDEREGVNEFVPGDGFVVRVGDSEVRAGDQAGAQGQEKQQASEKQRFDGGPARDAEGGGLPCGVCAPVGRRGGGGRRARWK